MQIFLLRYVNKFSSSRHVANVKINVVKFPRNNLCTFCLYTVIKQPGKVLKQNLTKKQNFLRSLSLTLGRFALHPKLHLPRQILFRSNPAHFATRRFVFTTCLSLQSNAIEECFEIIGALLTVTVAERGIHKLGSVETAGLRVRATVPPAAVTQDEWQKDTADGGKGKLEKRVFGEGHSVAVRSCGSFIDATPTADIEEGLNEIGFCCCVRMY